MLLTDLSEFFVYLYQTFFCMNLIFPSGFVKNLDFYLPIYQDKEWIAKIGAIIFEDYCFFCNNCGEDFEMATVHQGAYAAKKMREREEKIKASLNPMQYNTKFMDSIWGQYNRYSVHNLKKVMDEKAAMCFVSPTEKFIPKMNEKIFSAGLGPSPKRFFN